MSDFGTKRLLRRRRVTCYRQRGPIYNWLRAHYADICALMASGEGTWPRLCCEMQRHGVVARGGATPSEKAASKAWQTVCRDLADKSPAAPKRPGAVYPSRIRKDWRPTVVHQPEPARVSAQPETNAASSLLPPSGFALRPPPPKGPGMSLMEKLTGIPDAVRKASSDSRPKGGKRDVAAEIAKLREELAGRSRG